MNIVIEKLNKKCKNGAFKSGYIISCYNINCNNTIYVKKGTWENNLLNKYPRLFSCSRKCKYLISKTDIYIKRNLENFGYENGSQKPEIVQKIKDVCLEKYGVENPFQFEKFKQKSKETNIIKYGTEYYNQSEISIKKKKELIVNSKIELMGCVPKHKYKETMMNRYGVKHIFNLIKFNKKYYIDKYGEEDGILKWNIRCNKTKHNLLNFIERYGKILGKIRYNKYLHLTLNNYNGVSNIQLDFSKKLYDIINDDNIKKLFKGKPINDSYLIFLSKNDRIILKQKVIIPDIVIKNIIIEFDGDYWHSKSKEKDDLKDTILKNKNYHVIRVKECDYNYNNTDVLNSVLNEINKYII